MAKSKPSFVSPNGVKLSKSWDKYSPKNQKHILETGETKQTTRLRKGLDKGFTRAQASGKGGTKVSELKRIQEIPKYERAIKDLKRGSSLSSAAKNNGVSTAKLKKYMKEQGVSTKKGSLIGPMPKGQRRVSQTVLDRDPRAREWYTLSGGNKIPVRLDDINSSINGRYLNDVQSYIRGRMSLSDFQRKWKGATITTVDGQVLPLDTDPRSLRRSQNQPNPNPYRIDA